MTMRKDSVEYIDWLICNNDRAVERAVVAIYKRQEPDEQASGTTNKSNGRGFNKFDGPKGSYYAKWILGEIKGEPMRLTGRHLDNARVMMRKYVRQLSEIASAKIAAQAMQEASMQADNDVQLAMPD